MMLPDQKIRWKVCGMKYIDNLREVISLNPDYVGFIFYPRSKRYMVDTLKPNEVVALDNVKKVGVFVNEISDKIDAYIEAYGLDGIQLHGDESPQFCARFTGRVSVIKSFSIGDTGLDQEKLMRYEEVCNYILFDTKGKLPGGNGYTFNWDILNSYSLSTPFFLSGGISLANMDQVCDMLRLPLHSVDVNSQFEIEPGKKDIDKLRILADKIEKWNNQITKDSNLKKA